MVNTTRFLGELDSDFDKNLFDYFVETPLLNKISNSDTHLIYGFKGVGKTALRKAIVEAKGNNDFWAARTINLSSISFSSLLSQLKGLQTMSAVELPNLSRVVWMNALVQYAIEIVKEKTQNQNLKRRINNILESNNFIINNHIYIDNANRRLSSVVENLIEKIIAFGIEDANKQGGKNLNSRQLDIHNIFPTSQSIIDLLNSQELSDELNGKKIAICLDGFDSIVDHTPEARKAIFAGLIDSIFNLRNNDIVNAYFCFKAFLPREFTADAESIVWDGDKHKYNIHSIIWSNSKFQLFLEKRLYRYSRRKSQKFSDLWPEYMSEKITNPIHNIEENTFEYILRHTLFRPRQVLTHLQMILDKWDEKYTSFKVDPSFIPQVVAETNEDMADQVSKQIAKVYHNIQPFLKSWYKSDSIMEVITFK
jgi:Cdc6-like AAA superfamily ATPase